MSQVVRCDKCKKIIPKHEAWEAEWELRDSKGEKFDEDVSDLCESCSTAALTQLYRATNVKTKGGKK